MRKLITLWLLLISSFSFGQVWEGGFGNAIQRTPTTKGYNWRFNLGVGKGVLNTYSKERLDSLFGLRPLLPIGQRGQQLKVSSDNTNVYTPAEPLIYGQFIYNTAQLNRAFNNGKASQQQIFNSFGRFAHGGDPNSPGGSIVNGKIPVRADQTNSWSYDTVSNAIVSTYNTGSFIGFYSPDKFTRYIHDCTFSANDSDNDFIGLVIAFSIDSNRMVKNQAYGLNPSDFSWPINVTDSLIPYQHTLSLIRERQNVTRSYVVYYDYNLPGQKIIANGSSGVYQTTAAWSGVTVDVEAKRISDSVFVKTTNFSDAPGGKGSLSHLLSFSLASDTALYKFRKPCSYGYCAYSQAAATYSNVSFSGSNNLIYDLRNGNIYQFLNNGYVIDNTKNMYRDLGTRFYWRNTFEHTFGYILPTNTYDVIVGTP